MDAVLQMTLRCLLLGHRRSRSCASFDEKHGHWISECKRCHVLLVREGQDWRELPRPPDKLVPVERKRKGSGSASRSSGESPFVATGATNSADRNGFPAVEGRKQPVELTTP